MKVLGTVLSTAALMLGFYQAPFSHIHVDDFEHPPSSAPIHWHLHHETTSTPERLLSAPSADDDAIDVGWNVVRCSAIEIPVDLFIAEAVQLPAETFTSTPVLIPHRRGHDPPELALRSPRSPPV